MQNKVDNNIPFDFNFNVTGQSSSQNAPFTQNINNIPQVTASNSKLGTNELLKSND